MKAALDDSKSIYLQISESIENDVLSGAIAEEELIPSTNQFAKYYCINPATAAKGVNILVDQGIVYKKRGIGMCVKKGARDIIRSKRKRGFYDNYLCVLIKEAAALQISKSELIKMIEGSEDYGD